MVPPHSDEAELGLVGCVLLDPERTLNACAEARVQAECFYQPRHQLLFQTAFDMQQRGEQVDLLTLTSRLRDLGRLEQVGGEAALIELVDRTPTTAHAGYYIKIVFDRHILRALLERSRRMAELCHDTALDPAEVLSEAEQMVLEIGQQKPQELRDWKDLLKTSMTEIEHLLDNPASITGLSTGYASLDKILLGLQPSEMIVLAARPSMGKTSLAMNIVENIALGYNQDTGRGLPGREPAPVAVFSLEMAGEALVRRMLCSLSGVPWNQIVNGGGDRRATGAAVRNAAGLLLKAPIFVDDSAGLSVLELRARARRLKRLHGIRLIVVDYLQMLNYPQLAKEGRQRETAGISGQLKAMAKELRLPVLVLSQLNRAPEDSAQRGVPKLADLRDSGSIEQDADVVMMLRRPCRNKKDPKWNESDPDLAIVDVAKQRNGRVGEVDMIFEERRTRFKDHFGGGPDQTVDIGESSAVDDNA